MDRVELWKYSQLNRSFLCQTFGIPKWLKSSGPRWKLLLCVIQGNFSMRRCGGRSGALPRTVFTDTWERGQRRETWLLRDGVSSFRGKTGILCLRRRLGDFRTIPHYVSALLYNPARSKAKQNPFTQAFLWRKCLCQLKCMALPRETEVQILLLGPGESTEQLDRI